MIKYRVCCVRDRAADVFMPPFCIQSTGQAIRSFSDEINRPAEDNNFYKHPDDFELFELGVFDDETAEFELLDRPRQLAIGRDLKVVKQ